MRVTRHRSVAVLRGYVRRAILIDEATVDDDTLIRLAVRSCASLWPAIRFLLARLGGGRFGDRALADFVASPPGTGELGLISRF
jgi:hypothetical protein